MDRSYASTGCFLMLVLVGAILGREVFEFKTKQNDVFLNFRGEDTRFGIISHLDDVLSKRKIKTFIDSILPRGEDLASLLKEIEGSRVAVVVFSEDYASSSWCLDELVRITECRGILRMKVLPIFYRINPSDVSNQNGSFQAAFDEHEKNLKDEMHRVHRWRAAIMEVSSLAGLDSNLFRREPDLVKKAVDDVVELLRYSRLEKETAAGRAYALFSIFIPVVILLGFKDVFKDTHLQVQLFGGGFISSVVWTASILISVFLGFWVHDYWVYLDTLDSYSDALPFSIFYVRIVVPLFVIVAIGLLCFLCQRYMGTWSLGKFAEPAFAFFFKYDDASDENTPVNNKKKAIAESA